MNTHTRTHQHDFHDFSDWMKVDGPWEFLESWIDTPSV